MLCGAVALVTAVGATCALAAGVTRATGVTGTSGGGWTTCTLDAHADVANQMIVRNNGGQPMCIGSSDYGDHFTVTRSAVNRHFANFPNIYTGCEFDGERSPQLCTSGHATPPRVSSIGGDSSSVSYYYPRRGFRGDAAYDIWFNKTGGTPKGRDNGAEIMIWLGTRGVGGPFYTRKVKIDGIWWGYASWRTGHNRWNYVRYWRLANETPRSRATLDLVPFFRNAESRGRLSASWYLTGTEFGFEVSSGGRGLRVKNFTDTIEGTREYLGGL